MKANLYISALLACTTIQFGSSLSADQNPLGAASSKDDDAMFRHLDANGDGTITKDDASIQNQSLIDKVFQMSGQGENATITREQFQRIAEQHRSGSAKSSGRTPSSRPATRSRASGIERSNAAGSQISREQMRRLIDEFDRYDSNANGGLDTAEMQQALEKLSTASHPRTAEKVAAQDTADVPSGRSRSRTAGTGSTTSGSKNSSRTARGAAAQQNANEKNSLAGVWRGWVVDGRGENPNAGHMEIELTIDGQTITARELGNAPRTGGGESMGNGTYTLTGSGTAGNLDAVGNNGRYEGNDYLGIFEIEGDVLRWCVGNTNRPRPQEFASGRGNYLMILRRQN